MRIFISYSSPYRDTADRLAVGLSQEGHAVFFDRDRLPAGEGYDRAIRDEVEGADLLIFLVAPEAVRAGAYTLTELGYARRRWRDPSGRVLPVMIAPTPFDAIPPYLRAVTVLEPRGNPIAEILAVVEQADRAHRRRTAVRLSTLTGLALAGLLAAAWLGQDLWRGEAHETCYLSATLDPGAGGLTRLSGLTLDISGGGETGSFVLTPAGLVQFQVQPSQLADWRLEVIDRTGSRLGTATYSGCPGRADEVPLQGGGRLIIRPR
jgi:hypothetical protein